MILRRVMVHVRSQNWFAVVLDFVIVVVGVYLGLQVQDWSKRQDDRRREMQIVGDILADLKIDRSEYANGMVVALRRISAATASLKGAGLSPIEFEWEMPSTDMLSYSFDIARASEISASRRDRLWTDVVLGYFPTPSSSAYDAMVGAGDIKVIQDRELVREIQLYHTLTASVSEQNENVRALRANILNIGAAYGLAPFSEMPSNDYFRVVASEPELAAAIRIQATFAIFHYGDIENADARAARLQDRLTEYLEDAK